MPTKRVCLLDCDYVLENTVHKFPNAKKDSERRKKWLDLIGMEEPAVKYIYLCSNHFSRVQYHGTLLNRDALPDINLHKCTFGSENDIKKPKEFADLPPEPEKKTEEDSNIRTIKVDVELYNRIVKAGFMDLGDENTLNKRRQLNTKSCQTEPTGSFSCSTIEYNFATDTYMIHCFFCDEEFSLMDHAEFEQHMNKEHKSIKECYNQYTVMDRRKLFELRKKIPTSSAGLNLSQGAWKYLKGKMDTNVTIQRALKDNLLAIECNGQTSNDEVAQLAEQSSSDEDSDEENSSERISINNEEPKIESNKSVTIRKAQNPSENVATQMLEEILRADDDPQSSKEEMQKGIKIIKKLTKNSDLLKKKSISKNKIGDNDTTLLDTLAQNLVKTLEEKSENASQHLLSDSKIPFEAVLHDENNYTSLTLSSDLEQNTVFYKNLQIKSNEDPLCCSDVYSSDEEENENHLKGKPDNEIRLRWSSPEVVHHFLDLIKTHTVLCFPRSRWPEKFDMAISNIILELSLAHQVSLTSLEIRRSINRIKNWYSRMLKKIENPQNNNLILPYPAKYDSYFKKCVEFLPRNSTSQKWFTTQAIHTDEQIDRIGIKIGYECEFCKVFLQTTAAYAYHMLNEHRKCTVCNLVCRDEVTFAEHLKSHLIANGTKRPSFTCPDCNRKFPLKNLLRAHMSRFCTKIPMGANLTCVKDGKVIKIYPCRMCDQTFEVAHMRRWHELKHDTPQYKCDLCPKAFYTKFPLEQHYKSHKNLRDYICDVCGKGYTSYKNLYCHQQTVHFRKKKFVCDLCGIDVTNNCNLARHKRIVHSQLEKGTYIEYKCRRKGKEYLCRKRIRANRSKPQKYKCKLCCIVFSRYKELVDHKRDHHCLNKAVKCRLCSRNVGMTYMKRHLKQVHKLEEAELQDYVDPVDLEEENNPNEFPNEDEFIVEDYETDNDPDNVNDIENDHNTDMQINEENEDFEDLQEFEEFINEDDQEDIIKAAAHDVEQNSNHQSMMVTEEDLAYMVFDECS